MDTPYCSFNPTKKLIEIKAGTPPEFGLLRLYVEAKAWLASEEGISVSDFIASERADFDQAVGKTAVVVTLTHGWRIAAPPDLKFTGGIVAARDEDGFATSPLSSPTMNLAGAYASQPKQSEHHSYGWSPTILDILRRSFRQVAPIAPPFVTRLQISAAKCIPSMEIPLQHKSSLPGSWTCIAGINGAGKSTILQSIALALLGDNHNRQLGQPYLDDFTSIGQSAHQISLSGPISRQWAWPNPTEDYGHDLLVLGYGASRNLSERPDGRNDRFSIEMSRVASLFNPHSELTAAEVLLGQVSSLGNIATRGASLIQELLKATLDGIVSVKLEGPNIEVTIDGKRVQIGGLPDGYRSTLAWMTDLIFAALDKREQQIIKGTADPETPFELRDISALVLIDEIDLHLHPALQRSLVTNLRKALPNVQWIVTTHSPLVLSCFDRNELIVLDRDEEGGLRQIDRQILSFSANEVIRYLMGVEPSGLEIERILDDPSNEDQAVLIEQSEEIDEDEAKVRVERRNARMKRLLGLGH